MTIVDGVIEQEIRVQAAPAEVFPYFTDPAKMRRWQGVDHTLEARPGGVYRVDMNGTMVASGTFIEIDPPRRVVFSFGWEGEGQPVPPGSSTVEVTLTPDGDGTVVRLVHRGLGDEALSSHGEGWEHYLGRLSAVAGGSDPGPDPWAARPDGSAA
ncbi:MAG TPA: SRPBCC domain-containing protein [Acidimicrobiales bacterium]|nr:SRPBCC domain-containing protein [Acidimicrobiales bacterium]